MKKCKQCGNPMTWAQEKQQYKRLIVQKIPPEEIKKVFPLCNKCTTQFLKKVQV